MLSLKTGETTILQGVFLLVIFSLFLFTYIFPYQPNKICDVYQIIKYDEVVFLMKK